MKFRTGFVSNSSSSSYVIAGWRFNEKDENQYKQLLDIFKLEDISPEPRKTMNSGYRGNRFESYDEKKYIIKKLKDNTTLEFESFDLFELFLSEELEKICKKELVITSFYDECTHPDSTNKDYVIGVELSGGDGTGIYYTPVNFSELHKKLSKWKKKLNIKDRPTSIIEIVYG